MVMRAKGYMIEVDKLSRRYKVKPMNEADVDSILELYQGNPQFYRYTESVPSREQVISDMKNTPNGVDGSKKYYVGFYKRLELIAVMDIIDGFPTNENAYIGFFMMKEAYQGKKIGSIIVHEVESYLRSVGKRTTRLAIDKLNPQSTYFWDKNGYIVFREVDRNGWPILEAEKIL